MNIRKLIPFIFILLTICEISKADRLLRSRLILLIGPTRAGKSCFINTITGKNFAVVGDDSGDSTTKSYDLYESKIDGFPEEQPFDLIDTMGLDDTEESGLGDPMLLSNTTLELKKILEKKDKNGLDAILVFESLTNDSNNLGKTLKKLKAIFDESIYDKIIVVLNKNPNPNAKRLSRLLNIIKEHRVKYIHWKSGCNSKSVGEIYYEQMNELHKLILNVPSWDLITINNHIKTLKEEGRKLFKEINSQKFNKYSSFLSLGTAGLLATNMLGLPAVIVANMAIWGFNKLSPYLVENDLFFIFLAMEERIKNKFSKNGD